MTMLNENFSFQDFKFFFFVTNWVKLIYAGPDPYLV